MNAALQLSVYKDAPAVSSANLQDNMEPYVLFKRMVASCALIRPLWSRGWQRHPAHLGAESVPLVQL